MRFLKPNARRSAPGGRTGPSGGGGATPLETCSSPGKCGAMRRGPRARKSFAPRARLSALRGARPSGRLPRSEMRSPNESRVDTCELESMPKLPE
eukprot:7485382-Pyramimonas_sp.AAC.1